MISVADVEGKLRFAVGADDGTYGMLTAMLPLHIAAGRLVSLRRDGAPVRFATDTIKGIEYALFPGESGVYEAADASAVGADRK